MGNSLSLATPIDNFRHYLIAERALSKNTIEAYTRDIRKFAFFIDETGKRTFGRVRSGDIVEYMITQKRKGMAINSLSRNIVVIKLFFRFLAGEELIKNDVAREIDAPRLWKHLPEVLTVDEVDKLINLPDTAAADGIRDRAILEMLYATGMRISELVDLKLNQFDPVEQFVRCKGKGSKERIVPFGDNVKMMLYTYVNKVRPEPTVAGCDRLFLSSTGKPITANTIKLVFSRLSKQSGVHRLHAHLCRHTFATNYLLNGGDIHSLQEILGHTTLEMVNRYVHFNRAQLTAQHHRFSPMDKLHGRRLKPGGGLSRGKNGRRK